MSLAARRILAAALGAGVLVLASAPDRSLGQEPEPPPETGPVAIPAAEVAERSDSLLRTLRQSRERLAPVPEVETIAAELGSRAQALSTRRAETETLIANRPALARLADLEREWARDGAQLEGWRRALTRRAAALEAEVEQLSASEETWQLTLGASGEAGSPREVLDAVRGALSQIRELRNETSTRLGQVLGIQNRVARQELVVAETIDTLQAARAAMRSRLFEPEEPALWSIVSRSPEDARAESIAESARTVRDFLVERRARLVVLGLIFALAAIIAIALRSGARRAHIETGDDSLLVLDRPIAFASLVALLSGFWLFPLAPEALLDLVGLVLLFPLLRLLPSLMHVGFRPMLYGLSAFYLVDRVRDVLEAAPIEARLLFAGECAAGAVLCGVLLRPTRLARIPDPERFPRWPRHAVRLSLVLFSAAFIANLLGYVSLGTLLGDGLLASIYIAVVLYAGFKVVSVILDVATDTAWARQIHFLRARRSVALQWIKRGVTAVVVSVWAYWTLAAFALQDAVLGSIAGALTASLEIGTITISAWDFLAFALTIVAAVVISRIVRFVLMEDVFSRLRTPRGVPHAVGATAHYLILFLGFVLALGAAGIDFSRFTLLAGAFGVGIGFGLQNVVNNFVSGIILLYERPIQVGDTIDMGDLMGVVRRIGIRSSTVRTYAGAEVIVPNGDLISQRVINWTLSDKSRRIDVPIGVRYGSDPSEVIRILKSVAAGHERVLPHPPPAALFRAHGDSSLDFELRVWIADFNDWFAIESELNEEINRSLAEADIEIPFPQRDLHLRSIDERAARSLSREEDAE